MRKFFLKPYRWAILYALLMIFCVSYVLLDTFVIPRALPSLSTTAAAGTITLASDTNSANAGSTAKTTAAALVTANSYQDENIKISIETLYEEDTAIYLADIQLSSLDYFKTALAANSYGRNITAATSDMAAANQAIFAINGDYYGFRNTGFVLRNGILYRDTARTAASDEALLIDQYGDFSIIHENATDAQALANAGAWQIFSFGPALVEEGQLTVSQSSEVSQSMTSNPRTAIGQISLLHYLVIVSDGRSTTSAGLSLLQLAELFVERGCTVAYNLDGGGSSTMWFNGQVINHPANGKSSAERSVSDIVYIG